MKTFNFTRYTVTDKQTYEVLLTWERSFEFTKLKATKKFLAQTNRFLTATLVELNDSLSNLQTRYRRNWLLFFHNKPSHSFLHYHDDRTCNGSLESVEQLLNVAFNHHGFVNGSVIVFENFRKSFDYLLQACNVLRKYYKRGSDTVSVWEIDILTQRLMAKRRELEAWGTETANRSEMKIHFSVQQIIPLLFTQSVSS